MACSRMMRAVLSLCALAALGAASAPLGAQEIGPGMGDVFGMVGFAKSSRGGDPNPSIGGGASLGIVPNLLGSAEFTYVPLDSYRTSYGRITSRMLLFDVTGQYVFPLRESNLEPYALAGFGVARTSVSGGGISSYSDSTALFTWGAGVRVPLTDRVGIKPELKAYTHHGTLFRVGVGLYYRFGN